MKIPLNKKNYTKDIAYWCWEQDGKPNGEQYINTLFGPMKIKDFHWMKGEMIAEFNFDIFYAWQCIS